jgi:MFS family permease
MSWLGLNSDKGPKCCALYYLAVDTKKEDQSVVRSYSLLLYRVSLYIVIRSGLLLDRLQCSQSTIQNMVTGSDRGESTETTRLIPGGIPDCSAGLTAEYSPVTTWIIIAIAFLLSAGGQMVDYSSLRTMESILCYLEWEIVDPSRILIGRDRIGPGAIGGVHEMYCKDDAIQSNLASLRGVQQFLDGLPGLVLVLPFSWAADRYGRRPLLVLGLVSFVLQVLWAQIVMWFWQTLDIHLVFCSVLPGLMGGSPAIFGSLLLTALSDITSSADKTVIFMRVGAANSVALLVVPLATGWLMQISPWLSSITGTVLMGCAAFLAYFFVPETSPRLSTREASPASRDAFSQNCSGALLARNKIGWQDVCWVFLTDYRVPVLLTFFVGHQLISAVDSMLIQFCSKRYQVTTASATLFLTIINGGKAVQSLIIMPMISTNLNKYFDGNTLRKDACLARISFCLIALGWTAIGLSSSLALVACGMVIAALGHGAYFFVRGLLSNLVPPQYVARLFSMISILDTTGYMFGGPLLSFLYRSGLQSAHANIGLPFECIGGMGFFFALVLYLLPLQSRT